MSLFPPSSQQSTRRVTPLWRLILGDIWPALVLLGTLAVITLVW